MIDSLYFRVEEVPTRTRVRLLVVHGAVNTCDLVPNTVPLVHVRVPVHSVNEYSYSPLPVARTELYVLNHNEHFTVRYRNIEKYIDILI